jgi:hypothetical protein
LRYARLTRRQFILFALLTAVMNGIVTATVGAWLAHTYTTHHERTQSIENLANLIYERRIRAGMVMRSLLRGAELDEVRYRKRAYDEAFVEWNKKVQLNVFMIRTAMGERALSPFELVLQDMLVPAMSEVDRCLTTAYDQRLKGEDPKPTIATCKFEDLHQFVLDCGATITNELDKITRVSLIPFVGASLDDRDKAKARIERACKRGEEAVKPAPAAPASTEAMK